MGQGVIFISITSFNWDRPLVSRNLTDQSAAPASCSGTTSLATPSSTGGLANARGAFASTQLELLGVGMGRIPQTSVTKPNRRRMPVQARRGSQPG